MLLQSLLLLLAAFANAQLDCKAEKENMKSCFKAIFAGTKGDWETKKAQKDECFRNAGCSLPSEKWAALKECKKNAFDQLKPLLETCVQRTIPGFSVPEEGRGGNHHHHHHRWGRKWGGHRGGHDKGDLLAKLCPSQAAQDSAAQCLEALKGERKQGRSDWRAKKEEMKACKANYPAECVAEQKETKAALCSCAASILADNSGIVAELAQCHNTNDGDDDEDDAKDVEEYSK